MTVPSSNTFQAGTTVMMSCQVCGKAPHQVTGYGLDRQGKYQDLKCAQCGQNQRVYNWKPGNAREKLVHLSQQFIIDNPGKVPTRVCISKEDEAALARMTRDEWGGNIACQVQKQGIRKAFTIFDGLAVSWDADDTHLE
jgi:hypothetical protein